MIKATAVVLAWNGRRWIGPCLDSLLASDYPGLEILVVDNASTDGTTDLAARYIPRVRLIRNRRNLGYAGGNNVGVRAALEGGAEMVALVNQDTRVEPDWLTRIVEVARADPRLGILSPSQWDYEGVAPDPSFLAVLADADPRTAQAIAAGRAVAGAVEVPTALGAALVLRRSLIERVGLFDPLYFVYFEEADLCRRARRQGFRVAIVPGARVYHWHGLLHPSEMSRRASFLSFRNQFVYELKDPARTVRRNLAAWLGLCAGEIHRCLTHARGARGGLERALALGAAQGWILLNLPRILAHRARELRTAAYL